ncbi:hypothetical protein PV08_00544 [Exophiala spinifera]|uniref:Uncharacterized protein n=1 Tax=Exophiala spinifera TaxID=91928 RepID=A0A0D2C8V4_9EURO|nr:uncharacterized protein PV08_00544 [Exophiala spinifera]KIW19969.1 hypothetical protein PV08_00544 [Exophiala spinifera]
MASAKKKVFVGSTYEFTQLGSDEIIRNLMQSYLDPENAPFITFGADTQANDDRTLPTILHQVSNYVTAHESRGLAFDEDERVKPMEGTVTDDHIRDTKSLDGPLGDWMPDVDSDGQDALESLQHLTAFWTPHKEDIKILPPLYAQQISKLTRTSIYFEEAEKRCRLFQGKFQTALEKLKRLEPLLEIIKSQQVDRPLLTTTDLLLWNPTHNDARIEYVNIQPSHPSYNRIIVNKGERDLAKKVIGELRTYDLDISTFQAPEKFSAGQAKNDTKLQASKLWDDFVFPSFGDAKNLEPLISSKPASKSGSNQKDLNRDSKDERIAMWTSKIVSGADPEIAPEVPLEPTQPLGRRRLLVADSDDEEDDEPFTKPSTIGQTVKKEILHKTESLLQTSFTPPPTMQPESFDTLLIGLDDDEADQDLLQDRETSVASGSPEPEVNASPVLSVTSKPVQDEDSHTKHAFFTQPSFKYEAFKAELPGKHVLVDEKLPHKPSMESSCNDISQPFESVSGVFPSPSVPVASTDSAVAAMQQRNMTAHSIPLPLELPSTPEFPVISDPPRLKFDSNAYGHSHSHANDQRGPKALGSERGNRFRGGSTRANAFRGRGSDRRGVASNSNDNDNAQARIPSFEGSYRRGRANRTGGGRPNGSAITHGAGQNRLRGGGRDRGRGQGNLVEITSTTSTTGHRHGRPGIESYMPLERATSNWNQNGTPNIMDDPLESADKLHDPSETQSFGSRATSKTGIRFSEAGSEYRATSIPLPNTTEIRQNSIALALAAIEANRKQRELSARQGPANQKEVEEKQPPRHSTMRQRGRNPGRKPAQRESKAEKQARLDKALLEAYGPAPINRVPKPPPSEKPGDMSIWKRQQISREKDSVLAQAHPDIVGARALDEQCAKLIGLLQSSFEAARAFNGHLNFDIGFGQVIATAGPHIHDNRFYDISGWNTLFDPPNGLPLSSATFTKILTTNGEDIDGVLRFRNPNKNSPNRLWSPEPGPTSVTYEFSCQNRLNEDFLIVVDQAGKHELRKGQINVGTVNMHVPESIWDCAATLSGHLNWPDPPETLSNSVTSFVQSLYVPPNKQKLTIVFRQPTDHEINIRNLIVRRVSYHDCNLEGCEDVQLNVVESKSLLFKHHPEDRNLWQGYEAAREEYETVANEGRIHYELSIVHKKVTAALKGNETLEIGERTPPETTGKSILKKSVIRAMLEVAAYMVGKMDFVGYRNVGTLMQLDTQDAQREQDIVATMGPAGPSIVGLGHRGAQSTRTAVVPTTLRGHTHGGRGSAVSPAHTGAGSRVWEEPVYGIRANEVAQVFIRPDGSKYRLGMGGAEVPVVEDAEEEFGTSTVVPDDSASRADTRRPGLGGGPSVGTRLVAIRERGFW